VTRCSSRRDGLQEAASIRIAKRMILVFIPMILRVIGLDFKNCVTDVKQSEDGRHKSREFRKGYRFEKKKNNANDKKD
jgi:hypothetical protein